MTLSTKIWKKPRDLFLPFSKSDIALLDAYGSTVQLPPGRVLFKEGASANAFFVVIEGRMLLESSSGLKVVIEAGDFFGELAVFSGMSRSATAKSITIVKLLQISRRQLDRAMVNLPHVRLAIQALYARRLFANVAKRSVFFRGMNDEELSELFDFFKPRKIAKGTVLLREGAESDKFFILLFGACDIVKKRRPAGEVDPGQFIGEIGILRKSLRTADVIARTDIGVLYCSAENFERLIGRFPRLKALFTQVANERDPVGLIVS